MAWEYSEKTKQLFMDAVHGKPGTHMGEVENPDGVGEHGSIACGDALKFTFRVEKNEDPLKDVIVEARYLTFGCTSAIAASEALCHILEEKRYTPVEALKITNADIVDYLEGLPKQKIHCSVMGAEALDAAIFDWAKKRGVDLKTLGVDVHEDEMEDGRIVCDCFSMTEPYIRRKVKELGLKTIPEITDAIKKGHFKEAESLSEQLTTQDFAAKVASAIQSRDFAEKREIEEHDKTKKRKKKKLHWGFEQKQRWESKGNM